MRGSVGRVERMGGQEEESPLFEEVYLKDVITDLIKLVPTILSQ